MTSVSREADQAERSPTSGRGPPGGPPDGPGPEAARTPRLIVVAAEVLEVIVPVRAGGFVVARLKAIDTGRVLVADGVAGPVEPGTRIRVVGRWVEDPRRGPRFRVVAFATPCPPDLEAVVRFLASDLVPGVGDGVARRLAEHLGRALPSVLDHADEARLARTPGVGKARARDLLSAWHHDPVRREALVHLFGLGVPEEVAFRAVQRFRTDTVRIVEQDPYRLAIDLPGVGFRTADTIARRVLVPPDKVTRARQAWLHVLESAAGAGHTCMPADKAVADLGEMDVAPADALRALALLEAAGAVVVAQRPLDAGGRRVVYLKRLHDTERFVAQRLLEMARRPSGGSPWRAERDLQRIETEWGLALDDKQREAVMAAMSSPLLVVTGGPGTGKTTIVKAMAAVAGASGLQTALAAPTGRAAQRLKEATGREATTLHRLLQVSVPDQRFRRRRGHPIPADIVVVDEASMVDLPLFAALLDALRPGATLVLVGDVDQLPPVRAGQVLWSIVASHRFPVVVLDRVFRQGSGSMIPINAQRILAGRMPLLARGGQAEAADFFFLRTGNAEQTAEAVEGVVCERLPRAYGFDPMTDILVLAPTHRGPAGVSALNARLQARLNPRASGGSGVTRRLYPGDKVLQRRNNYDLDLFNGDIGRVVSIQGGGARVLFGDREVSLSRADLAELEPAYALTVHKAQGSESPAVVIALAAAGSALLRREMLYTAVTRARRLVVLVGELEVLKRALRAGARSDRVDWLAERLVRGLPDPVPRDRGRPPLLSGAGGEGGR